MERGAPTAPSREATTLSAAATANQEPMHTGLRMSDRVRTSHWPVKDLLHDKGKIELWYVFEQDRDRAVVREWLESESIRAADDDCEDDF